MELWNCFQIFLSRQKLTEFQFLFYSYFSNIIVHFSKAVFQSQQLPIDALVLWSLLWRETIGN